MTRRQKEQRAKARKASFVQSLWIVGALAFAGAVFGLVISTAL